METYTVFLTKPKDLDVPVAFGFPAGHSDINYPLLFGKTVSLNVSSDIYTLEWN